MNKTFKNIHVIEHIKRSYQFYPIPVLGQKKGRKENNKIHVLCPIFLPKLAEIDHESSTGIYLRSLKYFNTCRHNCHSLQWKANDNTRYVIWMTQRTPLPVKQVLIYISIIIIKVHYIHSSLNPVGSWKHIICYVQKVEKVILNSIYMLEILY